MADMPKTLQAQLHYAMLTTMVAALFLLGELSGHDTMTPELFGRAASVVPTGVWIGAIFFSNALFFWGVHKGGVWIVTVAMGFHGANMFALGYFAQDAGQLFPMLPWQTAFGVFVLIYFVDNLMLGLFGRSPCQS